MIGQQSLRYDDEVVGEEVFGRGGEADSMWSGRVDEPLPFP